MTAVIQGILNLDCIVADPKSRFLYGIASANQGTSTSKDGYTDSTILLVRSNDNPANLSTLTWTVISQTNGKDFSYNYPTFTSVDCAVDSGNEFSAFFRSPYRTTSPSHSLPMGVRYTFGLDTWSAIQGWSLYGWNSDRVRHMSFYEDATSSITHLFTNEEAYLVMVGTVNPFDGKFGVLSLQRWEWANKLYLDSESWVDKPIDNNVDYARRGFFSPMPWNNSRQFIIIYKDIVYRSSDLSSNATCHTFNTNTVSLLSPRPCRFQGPSREYERLDNAPDPSLAASLVYDSYLFAGERNQSVYFGGLFQDENGFKIFTTEEVENRTYLEHTIKQIDINNSDFAVHPNFQTVGGLSAGQEPFVVALTSAGLYQFTIFGAAAGMMDGPYKVKIANDFGSLPQRVVARLKNDIITSDGVLLQEEQIKPVIGGGIGAALVATMLVIGFLFWRDRRRTKEWIREEKEREKKMDVDVEPKVPKLFAGKYEVLSIGIIPEDEGSSDQTRRSRASTEQTTTAKTPPLPDARLLSYTYQDHIHGLDLSSHPRPNVIISVGDAE